MKRQGGWRDVAAGRAAIDHRRIDQPRHNLATQGIGQGVQNAVQRNLVNGGMVKAFGHGESERVKENPMTIRRYF